MSADLATPLAASPPPSSLIDDAVALARALQERATVLQTPHERRQQAELDRMLQTPGDKVTLVELTDEAFRSGTARRTAEHLTHILDVQGIPRFFSPIDRALLRGFQTFGGWAPGVAVPLIKEHMHRETANVVLPAEQELLAEHLAARAREGVRMNLNFLGEALLGEEEASRRLEKYLEALQLPQVEVMSVKISTIYSQISPLAREHTLRVLRERLELLYRTATRLRYRRPDGTEIPKFLYLDMEEYRDLALTSAVFMRTLELPGLECVRAGIALQAYIPDSMRVLRQILEWADRRVAAGGAPVTVRLVKGANMEMERVEAAQRDWPQAPFQRKAETDANYKRMLHAALEPGHASSVIVGVASHNLFDLAYGLVLARQRQALDRVQFEMLEGMANHQRRSLLEQNPNLLLYAPACRREEFLNAIGYLIRRLDENTGPENFLRHAFRLKVGTPEWSQLERGFRECFQLEISDAPRRTQNRRKETFDSPRAEMAVATFHNEPDTDWALPENSAWASSLVQRKQAQREILPLVIGGEERPDGPLNDCADPSRPGVVLARHRQAAVAEIDEALACAQADPDGWRARSVDDRNAVLGQVARELRRARGDLLWAALANGGKPLTEGDPEVSEAIDFVELSRASARMLQQLGAETGFRTDGRGVIVVVPPWNFPLAIPCGGVTTALAAGNTVILKPASDTVLVAWELCQCFWRAGISRRVLQFVPCAGRTGGQHLVTHPAVDSVILTGGTATALGLLQARPDLRLFAETGGKNATIVTALADRELAIKHIVHSAFSHAGQKCSATSLLLLEAEVYDDPGFRQTLCDAASSLPVGSAWELSSRLGPLIRPPSGDLETALKTLEPGESWALLPRCVGDNARLWTPGIKYGVRPGSYTHLTEFFGPVLGVMRFTHLAEAIDLVNQTGYGLTSGLHSLDEREHAEWKAGVRAGNLYINRGTTGAIVLRQPFGGFGKSCVGPGLKAGGPNYLVPFVQISEKFPPETSRTDVAPPEHRDLNALWDRLTEQSEAGAQSDAASASIASRPAEAELTRLRRAMVSYDQAWRDEFSHEHDHLRLLGQDNHRRYLPLREIRVRGAEGDTFFDLAARAAAARVTGARVIVSHAPGPRGPHVMLLDELTEAWAAGIEFVEETDAELAAVVNQWPAHSEERIRYAARERVPPEVRRAAAAGGHWLADEPVLPFGRVELLWYLREQSVSFDYHRYGNLGARAGETRRWPG